MNESLKMAAGWISRHRWGVLWAVVAGVGLYVLTVQGWPQYDPKWVLPALAGLAIALHIGYSFTRDLSGIKGEITDEDSATLRRIFRYAYVFLGIAFLLPLFMFVAPKEFFTSKGVWVGVADGCLRAKDGFGSVLTRCDEDGSGRQWLLQIGSWSSRVKAIDAATLTSFADKARAACTDPEEWSKLGDEFEKLRRPDGAALVAALKSACPVGGPATAMDMDAVLRKRGAARDHSELSRGLVVPLYVVVLALFGGAVGMSRRVPEIQRRAAPLDRTDDPEKAISAIVAREQVVFQIMQVLAAPLIAITAFAAFEPHTTTVAVLIGFASGFASELILLKLRQASEAVVGSPKASGTDGPK